MRFLPSVVRAEYRGGFRIHLAFNHASEGTVDFEAWLDGPVFEPLKNVRVLPSLLRRGRGCCVAERGRHRAGNSRTLPHKPRGLAPACSRRRPLRSRGAAAEAESLD